MNNNELSKDFFVGFNWKMNPTTLDQARELFQLYDQLNIDLSFLPVLFVPTIFLQSVQKLNFSDIELGCQNISSKEAGAFTGQISGQMLASVGVRYALINHSETHRDHKLDFETIKGKLFQALQNNLIPVLCISFDNQDTAKDNLEKQLKQILVAQLVDMIKSQGTLFYIALEPALNIGSGKALDCNDIDQYLKVIQDFMSELGLVKLQNYKTLYGGSVNASNIIEIGNCKLVDGFLLGGASIDSDQITKIFKLLK